MRVLVTGSTGFLGRATCDRLSREGHTVMAVMRSKQQPAPKAAEIVEADLSSAGTFLRGVSSRPDVTVHLAAQCPPSLTGSDAEGAARVNRSIDAEVFAACRTWGSGVVYASTSSVYGLEGDSPKTEQSPLSPLGPYAAEKAASESRGMALAADGGTWFTALRISAPYGPGQRTKSVLQTFLQRARLGEPLLYHGTGKRQQDFTYVQDVVEALLCAIRHRTAGVFNIASGRPVSMMRLAELVVQAVPGCKSEVRASGLADPQENFRALLSVQKTARELQWNAQVPLEKGLRMTLSLAGQPS